VWISWAYLLAVAFGRATLLIAIAAASHLVSGAISYVSFTLLQDQFVSDPNGLISQILLISLWILGVLGWGAFIAGILRELPRSQPTPATAQTQGVYSTGR
jgi:hypothetical protein